MDIESTLAPLPTTVSMIRSGIPLAELSDASADAAALCRYGGKAASLNQLVSWGLPVPDYICITAAQFEEVLRLNDLNELIAWMATPSTPVPLSFTEISRRFADCDIPDSLIKQVDQFIQQHRGNSFAVRSSGTLEDGAVSSFAGLYESVLNVKTLNETLNAMRSCWSAFFADRAINYIQQRNIRNTIGLALVVQCLVPAKKSGVLFTVDPILGNDKEMLIEACFGLGEALVSGQVDADQYRYHWIDEQETERRVARKDYSCLPIPDPPFTKLAPLDAKKAHAAVLTHEEVAYLVRLALKIQSHAGRPVDIEWAINEKQFYILQSRPITELGFAGIEGEWTTADFRDGGVSSSVCTPFMSSLYKMVMDSTMADYLKRLGLPQREQKDTWLSPFYSRPYWNLSAAKHYLSKVPDFNERAFDEGLGIQPRYEGIGVQSKITATSLFYGLRALWVIKSNCKRKLLTCAEFANTQCIRLTQLKKVSLRTLATDDLYKQFQSFLDEDYFYNESTYFDFVYDNSNLNSLFRDKLNKLPFDQSDFTHLLSGLEGVSHLAQVQGLWELRASIESSQASQTYWSTHTSEEICTHYLSGRRDVDLDGLHHYLEKYGHHSRKELDLLVPRYVEEPSYVIQQLLDVLSQPDSNDPRQRYLLQSRKAESARLKLLASVKPWRRKALDARLRQVRSFLWWREELRDLSTKFYFQVRLMTCEVAKRLVDDGFLLDVDDVFFLEKSQLFSVLRGETSPSECQRQVVVNRSYYDSFRNYVIPDEIGSRYSVVEPYYQSCEVTDQISGVAGSPGVTTGVARIIADIGEAESLQEGDILITRCTDPGWTPKFAMLKGVVTETGGVLSHAAVICREYGIPAVLAVKGATREITDGQIITIDGSAGLVTLNR